MSDAARAYLAVLVRLRSVGLALLGAASLYGGTLYLAQRAAVEREVAAAELAATRDRYLAAAEARRLVQQYQPRFDRWRATGGIDAEPRLRWIEAVRGAALELRLPSVQIDLQPAETVALPAASITLTRSPMRLRMGVAHEGELIALLRRLRALAPGLFWTERCDLSRADRRRAFAPRADNLTAECELAWLVVRTQVTSAAVPL